MPDKKAMMRAAGTYLKRHPEELVRAVKNAAGCRVGVPLDALRYLASQVGGRKAPKDVRLSSVPPGIRASAIVNLAGVDVRASATVFVERVRLTSDELRFEIRLADVDLELVGDAPDSPVATLLKSGALDLSQPGNLVAYMPKRPPMLVEAQGDRIVLDLKKHKKFSDAKTERIVQAVLAWFTVSSIETDSEHLDVVFRPLPYGFGEAVAAVRTLL